MTKKILYIEDMEICYQKTRQALGCNYELDWRQNIFSAMQAIWDIDEYDAVVIDGNLIYDSNISNDEQSTEGIEIAKIIRANNPKIPILFSSSNQKIIQKARDSGVETAMFKRQFWEGKGKEKLEELLK